MDRNKYTNKCFKVTQTNQFWKFNHDPTKSIEGTIQRILRQFVWNISTGEIFT